MILIVTKKADDQTLEKVAQDFDGYIKVVIDINRQVLSAGGLKHVDGEQVLLENGSKQQDAWGGGLDLETGEVDFDSMINIRPGQNNPSREVLSMEIRKKMEEIIRKLLK